MCSTASLTVFGFARLIGSSASGHGLINGLTWCFTGKFAVCPCQCHDVCSGGWGKSTRCLKSISATMTCDSLSTVGMVVRKHFRLWIDWTCYRWRWPQWHLFFSTFYIQIKILLHPQTLFILLHVFIRIKFFTYLNFVPIL